MIEVFSILRSAERVVKIKQHKSGSLDCLHGLRFISAAYVVIGHQYFVPLYNPPVNSFEIVEASIYLTKDNNNHFVFFLVFEDTQQFSNSRWYRFRGQLPGDKRPACDLPNSELSGKG